MKTALLSVFNKTDAFAEFAVKLTDLYGFNLLASGGTKDALTGRGIAVQDVGEVVGKPILGHRVVTLSREVYASILARPWVGEDAKELDRLNLSPIELVYVDMYPLADAIKDTRKMSTDVIEMVDIGGPGMLRAANKAGRLSISSESQFNLALKVIERENSVGGRAMHDRAVLCAESERRVADYVDLTARFYQSLADSNFDTWRKTL